MYIDGNCPVGRERQVPRRKGNKWGGGQEGSQGGTGHGESGVGGLKRGDDIK